MDKLNVVEEAKREQEANYCGMIGTVYLMSDNDLEETALLAAFINACRRFDVSPTELANSAVGLAGYAGATVPDAERKIQRIAIEIDPVRF